MVILPVTFTHPAYLHCAFGASERSLHLVAPTIKLTETVSFVVVFLLVLYSISSHISLVFPTFKHADAKREWNTTSTCHLQEQTGDCCWEPLLLKLITCHFVWWYTVYQLASQITLLSNETEALSIIASFISSLSMKMSFFKVSIWLSHLRFCQSHIRDLYGCIFIVFVQFYLCALLSLFIDSYRWPDTFCTAYMCKKKIIIQPSHLGGFHKMLCEKRVLRGTRDLSWHVIKGGGDWLTDSFSYRTVKREETDKQGVLRSLKVDCWWNFHAPIPPYPQPTPLTLINK